MAFRSTDSRGLSMVLAALLLIGSTGELEAVQKGERFYLSIPVSYFVYQADAKTCALPPDRVRCEGGGDVTICSYRETACGWTYIADVATAEKVLLYPSEKGCSGFTIAGDWSAVLFPSVEECRNATGTDQGLVIEKVYGTYGTRMIVRRKSR